MLLYSVNLGNNISEFFLLISSLIFSGTESFRSIAVVNLSVGSKLENGQSLPNVIFLLSAKASKDGIANDVPERAIS